MTKPKAKAKAEAPEVEAHAVEGEAPAEPQEIGETGILEGGGAVDGPGVTVGQTSDLQALNERLGYPVSDEAEAEEKVPEEEPES